jgi:myo-inositol-1(or 4)-monophosphatase
MPEISSEELSEIYAFAVQLGKDAGDKLMGFARARWEGRDGSSEQAFEEKDSSVDIVTKADQGAPLLPEK